MRALRKTIITVLFAFIAAGSVFAADDLDENLRIELNASDYLFAGFSFGNTTDIGLDITTANNHFGGRFGFMVRESFLLGQNKDGSYMNISCTPYIGINIFNVCLIGGIIPYTLDDGTLSITPYVACNGDFDIIPVKNGLSNSLAIRIGTDWYLDIMNGEDPLDEFAVIILSILVPKVYVGVTYKFGYGMKLGAPKNENSYTTPEPKPIEILDTIEVSENTDENYDSGDNYYNADDYDNYDNNYIEENLQEDDSLGVLFEM